MASPCIQVSPCPALLLPSRNQQCRGTSSRLRPPFPVKQTSKRRLCEISSNAAMKKTSAKKSVHFGSELEATVVNYAPLYSEEDKPLLWYSNEDYMDLEAQNKQAISDDTETVSALQQVYQACLKNAVKRASGVRRGLSGEKIRKALEEQEEEMTLHFTNNLRGLEAGILPDMTQRRHQAIQDVLNAQANMAQAHPTMRLRSISKTAEHLSRASVLLAQKLAQMDAQEVAGAVEAK